MPAELRNDVPSKFASVQCMVHLGMQEARRSEADRRPRGYVFLQDIDARKFKLVQLLHPEPARWTLLERAYGGLGPTQK